MSYPDQVPARRPAAVTTAVTLLGLMALAAGVYAVTTLLALRGTIDRSGPPPAPPPTRETSTAWSGCCGSARSVRRC